MDRDRKERGCEGASSSPGWGPVAGSFDHGSETTGSLRKCGAFLRTQVLKKDCLSGRD
jgi:hypothetical protein